MFGKLVALCAGALALSALVPSMAIADGDRHDWDRGRGPAISEVFVDQVQGDPSQSTVTIKGRNLLGGLGTDGTKVMIGSHGPFEVLGQSTENELVVRCYLDDASFQCDAGDYKLSLSVLETGWRGRDFRLRGKASYDLTIAAVKESGGGTGTAELSCPCIDLATLVDYTQNGSTCSKTLGSGVITYALNDSTHTSLAIRLFNGDAGGEHNCSSDMTNGANMGINGVEATICVMMVKAAFDCTEVQQ